MLRRPRSSATAPISRRRAKPATSSSATTCSAGRPSKADRDGGLSGIGDRQRRRCGDDRRRQSRLDVEDHGQSRRPARRLGGAGRQRRHRAGGAAGPGQHDRPAARQRAAAAAIAEKALDSARAAGPFVQRPTARKRAVSALRRIPGTHVAPDRQHRREPRSPPRSIARSAPPICSSASSACSCCSAR